MKNETVNWLFKHTDKVHIKLVISVVLNIITSVLTVLFALLMRNVIDAASFHNFEAMKRYGFFILLLTVCMYLVFVLSHILQEIVIVGTMTELRAFLMSSLMRKDYEDIQKKHSGQWMNLLFSDIKTISENYASVIPGVAGMISRLLFAFTALIFLEPFLAGIYLVGCILIMIIAGLFRGKLKTLHRNVQEKEDSLHVFLQEIIENLLIVKAFGAEDYFDRKISDEQKKYGDARIKRRKHYLISVNLFSFAFRMGYITALLYGGYQLIDGTISYGTLTAVLHIISQMRAPIFSLSGILPKYYETIASTERIMTADMLREEPACEETLVFNGMHAKHLSFAYDRDHVIADSSFEIRKNDIVAVTGTSGGGKSTLFLLILGLLKSTEGEVIISTDKGLLCPSSETRSLFTYVPQGSSLFTGTIKDNIVFNHSYNRTKLEYALKTADAYDYVKELPEMENTMLGERGAGLSEGQIQRLSIARAIYSDAQVLLLDESTSALDEETEARVLNNIKEMKNKTVLIVTHRPAAHRICNRQLVIDQHHIKEVMYEHN